MMKRILVISCWVGLASYCAMALTVGPSGIRAMAQADAALVSMRENLSALSAINADYAAEWEALRRDSETTALEARSLGYIANGEVVVRLGVAPEEPTPPSPGKKLSYEPQAAMSERRMKEVAGIVAAVTAAIGLFVRLFASRRQREILVQEASRT